MQQTDPRKVRVQYEKGLIWRDAWNNNPRLAHPDEGGDFQTLIPRDNYLRPYMTAKAPDRYTWKAYGPPKGELYFTPEEQAFGDRYAGRLIVEPHIKPGASPNKQWPWKYWNKVVWLLEQAGVRVTQLGGAYTKELAAADYIRTDTIRQAAAVIACARGVVIHEGGLMHIAAATETPAVVIYGGFIAPEVTGYRDQTNLFTGTGLGCGMRTFCQCCYDAMEKIRPADVVKAALAL